MFLNLVKIEILKLRNSNIEWLLLISVVLSLIIGFLPIFGTNPTDFSNIVQMIMAYSSLFLPLITGVLATLLCYFEHQNGGWRKLASLPIKKYQIYLSKYLILLGLIFIFQFCFLLSMLAVSIINGVIRDVPIQAYIYTCVIGWVSCISLAAFQLALSMYFKSFATPTIINVFLTFPALLIANTEILSVIYPWSHPMISMLQTFIQTIGGDSGFLENGILLVFSLLISSCLFLLSGSYYSKIKEY
ncbi:ABC transporter permease [Ureibacillus aquaedulcis]|uniref:ABC transporter permease n=1 Tax=Ureibacillus aquaedulcis TaxID=3058421 RepID=A0ABT8GVV0_9BACL|nr:ABC transporter permease [Ureibacillus sp. BA0131]MDN4495537.1 ABC transporter permease [Ureibacillus sp. BA0131]